MKTCTLKTLCRRYGNASHVAKLSGVAESSLSLILRGKRRLGLKIAKKLSKTFKLNILIIDGQVIFEERVADGTAE